MAAAKPVDSIRCSIDQCIANGELDRCRKVGSILKIKAAGRNQPTYRRLQSREREVATGPTLEWPRQGKAAGVALSGGAFDRRTAGIAKPDQFCGLVESLSGRVVECRAEAGVTPSKRRYGKSTRLVSREVNA